MKNAHFLSAAGFVFALAFVSSCSPNGNNGGDNNSGDGGTSPNNGGISYGVMTDNRDNQTYKTVVIDNKTWMAENLNYITAEFGYCYNDDPANCETYGGLYDWESAKKACPSGWHLATKDDWEDLVYLAGGFSSDATAAKLKVESGWNSSRSNGTNDYGFSAIPGGEYSSLPGYGYRFSDFDIGYWW